MSMNVDERRATSLAASGTGPTTSKTLLIDYPPTGLSSQGRDCRDLILRPEATHQERDDDPNPDGEGDSESEGSSEGSETGSNAAEGAKGKEVEVSEIPHSITKEGDLLRIFGTDRFRSIISRVPEPDEHPWDAPEGFMCLYECYFDRIGLWFPLPKLLTDLCKERQIAISQLTHSAIRHVVGMLTIAAEIGIEVDHEFFDEMCQFSPNRRITDTLYARARKGLSYVEAQHSNLHNWWKRYFFVEVSPLTVEDTDFVSRTSWNKRPSTLFFLLWFAIYLAIFAAMYFDSPLPWSAAFVERHLLICGPPENSDTRKKQILAAAIKRDPEGYERRVLAAIARMGKGAPFLF